QRSPTLLQEVPLPTAEARRWSPSEPSPPPARPSAVLHASAPHPRPRAKDPRRLLQTPCESPDLLLQPADSLPAQPRAPAVQRARARAYDSGRRSAFPPAFFHDSCCFQARSRHPATVSLPDE